MRRDSKLFGSNTETYICSVTYIREACIINEITSVWIAKSETTQS